MKKELYDIKQNIQDYIEEQKDLKYDIAVFNDSVRQYIEADMDIANSKEKIRACLAISNEGIYESGKELYLSDKDYINYFMEYTKEAPSKMFYKNFLNNFIRSYERKLEKNLSSEEKKVIRYDVSYLVFLELYGLSDLVERDIEIKQYLSQTKDTAIELTKSVVDVAKNGVNKGVKSLVKVLQKIEDKTSIEK